MADAAGAAIAPATETSLQAHGSDTTAGTVVARRTAAPRCAAATGAWIAACEAVAAAHEAAAVAVVLARTTVPVAGAQMAAVGA